MYKHTLYLITHTAHVHKHTHTLPYSQLWQFKKHIPILLLALLQVYKLRAIKMLLVAIFLNMIKINLFEHNSTLQVAKE